MILDMHKASPVRGPGLHGARHGNATNGGDTTNGEDNPFFDFVFGLSFNFAVPQIGCTMASYEFTVSGNDIVESIAGIRSLL